MLGLKGTSIRCSSLPCCEATLCYYVMELLFVVMSWSYCLLHPDLCGTNARESGLKPMLICSSAAV